MTRQCRGRRPGPACPSGLRLNFNFRVLLWAETAAGRQGRSAAGCPSRSSSADSLTSMSRFCGFGATGLAGQGAGRLSGLQRGLTSMWLSRVNTLFSVNLNAPFASALRRRAGPPGRLQTHKFNFRVLFWAETAAGRPGGRPAVGPPARTHSL